MISNPAAHIHRAPGPLVLALLLIAGVAPRPACASADGAAADSSGAARSGPSAPAAAIAPALDDATCAPLLIEPDYSFGTSVVMRRIPDEHDFADLRFVSGLHSLVIALTGWPATYDALRPLEQGVLPDGAQIVVILQGWPPTREAMQAWNLLHAPVRLILVVPGPPSDRGLLLELNRVRSLERVVSESPDASRSGFERLQRPLSFRVTRR